jgi:hypothetical protein
MTRLVMTKSLLAGNRKQQFRQLWWLTVTYKAPRVISSVSILPPPEVEESLLPCGSPIVTTETVFFANQRSRA